VFRVLSERRKGSLFDVPPVETEADTDDVLVAIREVRER